MLADSTVIQINGMEINRFLFRDFRPLKFILLIVVVTLMHNLCSAIVATAVLNYIYSRMTGIPKPCDVFWLHFLVLICGPSFPAVVL